MDSMDFAPLSKGNKDIAPSLSTFEPDEMALESTDNQSMGLEKEQLEVADQDQAAKMFKSKDVKGQESPEKVLEEKQLKVADQAQVAKRFESKDMKDNEDVTLSLSSMTQSDKEVSGSSEILENEQRKDEVVDQVKEIRHNKRQKSKNKEDAYALINFEAEGCTAVVPLARVAPLSDSCEVITGKECDVLWSSRRHFCGILLLIGSKNECEIAQEKYDDEDNIDNGSSTTVVVQVTVPPGYTVKTSSRGDDPLVERTPSPAPAEQLSTDIIHTVQETPSPLVEQHCINATPSVSATNKKRKRKQLKLSSGNIEDNDESTAKLQKPNNKKPAKESLKNAEKDDKENHKSAANKMSKAINSAIVLLWLIFAGSL